MTKLLIGTANVGKLREIRRILGDVPYELLSLADFSDIETPDESGSSYAENAILKATSYARQTGLVTLADDSGLEVEALDWAPGVLSARYAGDHASDSDRRSLLLSEVSKAGTATRVARFVCVVAIANPDGVINVAEGICAGEITDAPRGLGGFGYDPLFVPEGFNLTFAELPDS
ncbi:MAG TPA: non-canonical purine NTP pyrophosphatase, partial [Pyrinomonadaceae bacterium]